MTSTNEPAPGPEPTKPRPVTPPPRAHRVSDPVKVGSIEKGIGLLALGHAAAAAICAALAFTLSGAHAEGYFGGMGPMIVWFFGIGLVQLVYAFPLAILFAARGESQTVRGVGIGALVTALINGTCWALGPAGFGR